MSCTIREALQSIFEITQEAWHVRGDDIRLTEIRGIARGALAEPAEPVATLHDDGSFTWKRDEFRRKYDRQRAGWRMDVYAAPPAPQPAGRALTDAEIEAGRRQVFSTSNPFCPCDEKTMRKAVRWAERAHGIKSEGNDGR